jgi:hypothetical protein
MFNFRRQPKTWHFHKMKYTRKKWQYFIYSIYIYLEDSAPHSPFVAQAGLKLAIPASAS